MWNPKRIHFTNLFSHKDSEYEFLNGKCVIVSGENRSDRSLDNNGAGKTTLFEAITIALTNESLRNIKKDDFINRDEDECVVDMELENPALKSTLRIVRRFYRTKSVKIELWENGKINNQIVSVNEANKRVLELIGVSREDLLRYYIISQDNAYTFFTASDTDKKEVMNRITQASMIQPMIKQLDEQRLSIMAELGGLESKLCNYETKNETLVEQRNYIIEHNDSQSAINELKNKINEANIQIKRTKEAINEKEEVIKSLDKDISAIEVFDVDELISKKKGYEDKIEIHEKVLLEDKKIKRNLEAELEATVKCPECGHEFINGSELDLTVEDAKSLLKQTEKHFNETTLKKEKLEQKLSSIKMQIVKARENEFRVDNLEKKKRKMKQDIEFLQRNVSNNEDLIEEYEEEIEKRKKDDSSNKHLQKIDEDIKKNKLEIDSLKKKMKPLEDELEMVRFWLFNFGKSGFTTYLANKSVKTIEGVTNSYLRKFGVELSVLINGFKVLKSGDVREKIEVFVSNDGVSAEAFMSKSGGERSRVVLAGILGIQQLINNSLGGRGLDFLALDEAISGVDSRGTMEIIKTLDGCGKTVMMITQNIEDSTICSNVLRVVKEKGVSKYVI